MEEESNGKLVFLDTLLKRNNGNIDWYIGNLRILTNTYTTALKGSVASSLFNRAHWIKQVLKENGYQESIISKIFKTITNNHSLPQSRQQTQATYIQEEETRLCKNIPHFEGISEKLWCILRSHKIRSTFYTENTLHKFLCKPKDKSYRRKNNIDYEIDCSNCEVVCFYESEESLKSRSDKHKRSIRNCNCCNSLLKTR